jgi:gamma-tubulin complex component 4
VSAGPAALSAALRDYAALLPPLHGLAATLARRHAGGAALLTLLATRCASAGAPPLAAAYARLAWHARHAAFAQLTAWCVHGALSDAHGEFFIVPTAAAAAPVAAPAADGASGDASSAAAAAEDDGGAAEWHGAFSLSLQALPPWMELPTAEAALFCGRAVRVLRAPRGAALAAGPASELAPSAATAAAAARLAALACSPEAARVEVDAAVGALRDDIASRLWTLMVRRAALPAHLKALRDYFLMARGDFYAVFLDEARALLALPPRAAGASSALAAPFAAAAAKSTAGDDPLFSRVHIAFDAAPATAGGAGAVSTACIPSLDGWDGVCLRYAVDWPLGLLLTPSALATYNSLFQYLFRLRRAQAALAGAWVALRRGPPRRAPAAALRHRMDALLSAWASYVAAEVLAPAHAALLARVAGAHDWGDAARAHAAFLSAARGGTFLDLRPVAKSLEALLQLALSLAAHVRAETAGGGAVGADGGAAAASRVAELEAHWKRQAATLVAVLRGPQLAGAGGGRAPALRLFLARVEEDGLAPCAAHAAGGGAGGRVSITLPSSAAQTGAPPPSPAPHAQAA